MATSRKNGSSQHETPASSKQMISTKLFRCMHAYCLVFCVVCAIGDSESEQEKKETKERVAFITKYGVEILDGVKWRKYGKKMVKNSPNPRYRNSSNQQ